MAATPEFTKPSWTESMAKDVTIDELLRNWRGGSVEARDDLFERVYGELRRLAGGLMRHQSSAHTLNPTALVNEACLRLCKRDDGVATDRGHFLRIAASAMRQILVDHGRRKNSDKRGGGRDSQSALEDVYQHYEQRSQGLLDLEVALERLALNSPELVELVELRFFAGLPIEEVASIMGMSPRSVVRRWQIARAILHEDLRE
ncbi:MAG: RNA polymerase sigma factor (TIGR02999 family) [Planctomycetota bacterium]|jgi:RNA polymerase sigma factor (TIGR02999 family)